MSRIFDYEGGFRNESVSIFAFQENVINECQNMDKPVGKIRLVTRDPGHNKLFAVSLYSFRRVVNFCLKSVTNFFSKSLYKHHSQLPSNFILCYGPKFLTFRKFTFLLDLRVKKSRKFLGP